jgi:hypothetical protein
VEIFYALEILMAAVTIRQYQHRAPAGIAYENQIDRESQPSIAQNRLERVNEFAFTKILIKARINWLRREIER